MAFYFGGASRWRPIIVLLVAMASAGASPPLNAATATKKVRFYMNLGTAGSEV